jgi:hypothetical protein
LALFQKKMLLLLKLKLRIPVLLILTALAALLVAEKAGYWHADAAEESPLLFFASFEKNAVANYAGGDEVPLQSSGLKMTRDGRRGNALLLEPLSTFSYDAPGNLYAARGTVAFWWKSDYLSEKYPFSILRVSRSIDSRSDYTFLDLAWNGKGLSWRIFDNQNQQHQLECAIPVEPQSPGWNHIVLAWDELTGMHLYLDGKQAGEIKGEMDLDCALDQIGFQVIRTGPFAFEGARQRSFLDELRIFSMALGAEPAVRLQEMGAGSLELNIPFSLPEASLWNRHRLKQLSFDRESGVVRLEKASWIRKINFEDSRDGRKFSYAALDGWEEQGWPESLAASSDAGKSLRLEKADNRFNYLRTSGDFQGKVFSRSGAQPILLEERKTIESKSRGTRVGAPGPGSSLTIERVGGTLKEISAYQIQPFDPVSLILPSVTAKYSFRLLPASQAVDLAGVSRNQILTLYDRQTDLARRYLPPQREGWVAVPPEVYKPAGEVKNSGVWLHSVHVFFPPFLRNVLLEAVKMKFHAKKTQDLRVNFKLRDPLEEGRDLINLDFSLQNPDSEILFDGPKVVLPAGKTAWLTLEGNQVDFAADLLSTAEIELWTSEGGQSEATARSVNEFKFGRLLLIKDIFQRVSRETPWIRMEPGPMRRQFKLVNLLYALQDDIRKVFPADPLVKAYSAWLYPREQPDDFKQPENPDPSTPLWAFQQQQLLKQVQQAATWWIKNRQIASGELGNGIPADAGLVENFPGIWLMDAAPGMSMYDRKLDGNAPGSTVAGRSPTIAQGVLSFWQAGKMSGYSREGLNAGIVELPQSVREAFLGLPAATILAYGNPQLVESLMESSRHYEQITGVNSAGHRHFRSVLLNFREMIEDPFIDREEPEALAWWQAGMLLGWYNRHPLAIQWITENADALLAHWQGEKFPLYTRSTRFTGDKVLTRGLPSREALNLLWGAFRLTGKGQYLQPLETLIANNSIDRAAWVGGRWADYLEIEPLLKEKMLAETRKRTIWDRNLYADESGLTARLLAYTLTGDKSQVEESQAALIKHFAQNEYLYTGAEADFSWTPWPISALQRIRLGGVALAPGVIYPGHAISWENAGPEVSCLVAKASGRELRLIVYNQGLKLADVILRPWELENGTYEIVEGTDVTNDDKIDVVTTRRQWEVKRGTPIPLSLRPRKTTIIEVRQLKVGTRPDLLPDMAISALDLEYDVQKDQGKLTVHNLGGKATPPFLFAVENEKRTVLYQQEISSLEAPLDLKPRIRVVPLGGFKAQGARAINIRLDPLDKVEEICEENNQVRATFY